MKLFSGSMLAAALLAGVSVCADPVVYAKKADFAQVKKNAMDTEAGFQFKTGAAKNNFRYLGKALAPVEPGKAYKVSCEYRLVPGCTESGTFVFGIELLNKDQKSITIMSVNAIAGTQTELVAPAAAGDKTVKVKDASGWKNRNAYVAFNAQEDLSDLPNFDYIPVKKGDEAIEETADGWVLQLDKPLKSEYPAGTKVREHQAGPNYLNINTKNAPAAEWQTVSKVYSGFAEAESSGEEFRPGTAFIRPVITNGKKDVYNIEFRNIKIEEVEQ